MIFLNETGANDVYTPEDSDDEYLDDSSDDESKNFPNTRDVDSNRMEYD